MGYGMDEDWSDAALDHMRESDDQRNLSALSDGYRKAINSAIGATVACPVCDYRFVKKVKHHKFCGRKIQGQSSCKDRYHNTMNPRGLGATKGERDGHEIGC